MELISIIASVVAAVATVATLIFTVRTSRWSIRRRIERKQNRLHDIDSREFLLRKKYYYFQSPYVEEKWKLQDEIKELRKDL